jgi:pimeloyl-ACP methyl ester carboxylesterase
MHGFPDSAYTWRHLLPVLADAGFHAVAPFMRGYAPSDLAADGCYTVAALVYDATAIHEALGGDEDSVLIGHDWGAEAAYGAAAFAPQRWRRLVTLAVPPAALDRVLFADYEQLKRFFYMFGPLIPRWDEIVSANDMAMLDRLSECVVVAERLELELLDDLRVALLDDLGVRHCCVGRLAGVSDRLIR